MKIKKTIKVNRYRVSQKKWGLVFWAHFEGFNDVKSKSRRKFYLLGGVFRSVFKLSNSVMHMLNIYFYTIVN